MMDIEGVDGLGDLSIVGNEEFVRDALGEIEASGATDFTPVPMGGNPDEEARTRPSSGRRWPEVGAPRPLRASGRGQLLGKGEHEVDVALHAGGAILAAPRALERDLGDAPPGRVLVDGHHPEGGLPHPQDRPLRRAWRRTAPRAGA